MINYNIVLYIGLFFIIGGFCLFLYYQHRLRQLDIEEWKNQQLTKSFNKAKNDWNSPYAFRLYPYWIKSYYFSLFDNGHLLAF